MRRLRPPSLAVLTLAAALVGIGCFLVTLVLLLAAIRSLHRANTRSLQTGQTVAAAVQIEESTLQVIARERGYVATGDAAFLNGFDALSVLHERAFAAVAPMLSDRETAQFRALHAAVTRAVDAWAIPQVALARRVRAAAAALEATGIGLRRVSAVTAATRSILTTQRRLAVARDAQGTRAERRMWTVSGVGVAIVLLVALGYALFLRRSVVPPIRRLLAAMARVDAGDPDVRLTTSAIPELGELERGFNAMSASIADERRSVERVETQLVKRRRELERVVGELTAEKETAERLYGLAGRLAAETELPAAAQTAVDCMAEAVAADVAVLYGAGVADDSLLHLFAARGLDATRLPATVESAEAVRIAVGGEVASAHDLCVPLRKGAQALGVVVLARRGAVAFGRRERELLGRMGDQSALALDTLLSYARALRFGSLSETLIESSRDGIRLIGLDGAVLAQNSRMVEMIGRATGSATAAATFWEQAAAIESLTVDPGRFAAVTAELRAHPEAEVELEYELARTAQMLSRFVGPVRDADGTQIGRIVILRDVTAERQAQRSKDDFVASVTHELRTPLTSISGYLELLLDDRAELSDERQHFLEVVDRNAARLLRLVDDLLFVGRLDSGALDLEPATTDLTAILADAVDSARPAASEKGVTIELSLAELPELVADRGRLAQLIDNLLSNAIKFTPAGGRISVHAEADGAAITVAVSDTGIGVPATEKERLFDRFFRASSAIVEAVPGTGLGLAISKAIVDAHGGAIAVEDTPGGGTTFRLSFPLVGCDRAAA